MTIPNAPSEDIALLGQVNGNAYDAVTNPKGLARGGHRQNWASSMNALASVAAWVASVVTYITTLANQVAADAASAAAGSGTEATVANIRGGLSAFYLSIRRVYDAHAPVALTDATLISWDIASGINFDLVLAAAGRGLANPSNKVVGKSGVVRIYQDATGGRTITSYGSDYVWIGGEPAWPATAGAWVVIAYTCLSNGKVELSCCGASA